MTQVSITVNGVDYTRDVEPRLLLVNFLREECGLVGTHVGCDTSTCGACTVLVGDQSVKSCTLLAVQLDGEAITTVEGLAGQSGDLHPMQKAFHEHHGLQCGFCTPGMMMAAVGLLRENPEIDSSEIREGLEGNICRCTGYGNIIAAVEDVAAQVRSGGEI